MPADDKEKSWNQNLIAELREHGTTTNPYLSNQNLIVLTSIGAKSGEPRSNPVASTRDGDRWVIVGSNQGKDTDPQWVANVRANPTVTVETGGQKFKARATITEGAERERLLAAHQEAIPVFQKYPTMTARPLPVVTLERLPED